MALDQIPPHPVQLPDLIVDALGIVPYDKALALQHDLTAAHHQQPNTRDRLVLLEHPPTYTLGVSGKLDHLLIGEEGAKAAGFAIHHIRRGGDITYHGPGQLVGYPILNLRRLYKARGFPNFKLHGYVRELEEVIIRTLAVFGLDGWRYPGYTGVWIGPESNPRKIAAIGIHVSTKGISSHGFALNVQPDMSHFAHIIPCGIREHAVTSMALELQGDIAVADVRPVIEQNFRALFSFAQD